MEQRSIREVAAWAEGLYDGPDVRVSGVSIDSRRTEPGDLFVPLRGAHQNGHEFLGEAFASGAAAALVDRPEVARAHRRLGHRVIEVDDVLTALGRLAAGYRRSLDLKVVAVTGSNGKTTTKEMLRLVLGARAAVSPRSFNNEIGVPLTLLGANRHHEVCVVEMGTNASGEIARLAAIAAPDVALVLNVSESHLEGLGTIEGVAAEKASLIDALPPDGCAIVNWDDPHTRAMAARTDRLVLSFGTWPEADVFAGDVRARGSETSFKMFDQRRVRLGVLGLHNVHNALAAAAAAMYLGVHACQVCERLEGFAPAPMRMAFEDVGRIRLVNDAYNANPRSVEAAIRELGYRAAGRRVLVFGDMLELGPRARELHAQVGELAAQTRVDVVWAVGPLSEATAEAARRGGVKEVIWSPDAAHAAEHLPFLPRSRDVVLFKASRGVRLERLYEAIHREVDARRRRRRRAGRTEAVER